MTSLDKINLCCCWLIEFRVVGLWAETIYKNVTILTFFLKLHRGELFLKFNNGIDVLNYFSNRMISMIHIFYSSSDCKRILKRLKAKNYTSSRYQMPETSILLFHNRIYRTSLPLPMNSFSVLFKTRYNAKETANQIKRTQTGIRLASTKQLLIIDVFDILFIFLRITWNIDQYISCRIFQQIYETRSIWTVWKLPVYTIPYKKNPCHVTSKDLQLTCLFNLLC